MGHQCCSGRRKLLAFQIPGPEQFLRKAGMVVAPPKLYPDQTNFSMGRPSSGSSDGSLLIPTDKASTKNAVEEADPIRTETQTPTEAIIQAPRKQAPVQYDTHDGLLNVLSDVLVQPHDHVITIDSMYGCSPIYEKKSRHEEDHQFQKCL